jgi:vitamin B12/bleomycin/antimicrobial peptide transport system ATP-binding/permease protein
VILYKIYPDLFVAIFAYAGAGTAIAYALGQPLVGLNLNQLQKEADFRYSLIRVRENSESIGELCYLYCTGNTE